MALKHVYYHVRNELPVYVQYRIQDAWGWCMGMIQRDAMGWEVGGGFRIGSSYTTVVDSCQCMAKPIQYCKVKKVKIKFKKILKKKVISIPSSIVAVSIYISINRSFSSCLGVKLGCLFEIFLVS